MSHINAFVAYNLCGGTSSVSLEIAPVIEHFYGQWGQVMRTIETERAEAKRVLTCDTCKLLVIILRANKMEHLFDSNQRQMEIELRKVLKW
ncbi:MAG: hypothetical protein WAV09_02960 [Minisyncoccia bacterium]